ncbi:hypothetical protein UFOVP1219_3 [uncultured Caudovirales phage]|uniref:Uncharacterized protein n=1 Tax=uncultured Caudovirales phage TaxID=2100421 RepID=A0A6J7WUM5_9CAUD|nr:hypothetical protein UFOVP476_49 [uncultured Caudovirales phage]CAB4176343.1 hypothetical protein UFOVP986_26 [uncultured Caudovirales phage]CAB4190905.1 hypothetical protein UFOVP1219_3 [uncultured Caudovirales phage]CAB4223357.1 hypothetical protein UFOVP1671_52 [uncultured Caudovirales phage]CAB5220535.1 hypothetical protein UFOVP358_55 [uncultured Caudovirales phage]
MNYDNETWEERTARINKANEERRQVQITILIPNTVERARIKTETWNKVLLKITNGRTTNLNEMTYDEVQSALYESCRREDSKKAKVKREALKADGKCLRCGGAGRSDNWSATGYTCYSCNGSGKAQPIIKF